jgi:hypothetical protein
MIMTVKPRHITPAAEDSVAPQTMGLVVHMRSAGCRMMLACILGASSLPVGMAQAADIQPQDGQWRSRINVESVIGCAPEMRADIEADAIADGGESRFIAFSQPLQASDLDTLVDTEMNWERIDANRWVGKIREIDSTFLGRVESRIDSVLSVYSASSIAQHVDLHLLLPPLVARQMGSDVECKMKLTIQHDRIGG